MNWFEYAVRVQPHHTDYAGITWHGSYIAWMEEARVDYLRSQGIEYADLVAMGCDMPVVDLSIRYRRAVKMGSLAIVKLRIQAIKGVRIVFDYEIYESGSAEINITAQTTLVTVDRDKGKIMRQFPPQLAAALAKMQTI
jgi:acyl-CoA thioester hydrolase